MGYVSLQEGSVIGRISERRDPDIQATSRLKESHGGGGDPSKWP